MMEKQVLTIIPEADEVLIDDPEKAKPLFTRIKRSDESIQTLFYKDKRVEQLNSKKALCQMFEEFPDQSKDEILRHQQEILANTIVESQKRKGKAARKGNGRGGRGRGRAQTTKPEAKLTRRTTRSSGVRIEEIYDQPISQQPRLSIDPVHKQV